MENAIALALKKLYEKGGGHLADVFTNVSHRQDIIPPEMVIFYCADVLDNPKDETLLLHVLYGLGDVCEIQGLWDTWAIAWGTKAITCCRYRNVIPKIAGYVTYPSNPIRHCALWAIYRFLDNAILFLTTNDNDVFKTNLRFDSKFYFGEHEINQIKALLPMLRDAKKELKNITQKTVINDIRKKLRAWEGQKA